ncbi:MAG: hypothetical protein AB7G12_12770 [Thermoanaerobaculia bacterium]
MPIPKSKGGVSGQTEVLFRLTGDKELDGKLRDLDRDMQRKIAGKANNAGLMEILKAQRDAAPNKRLKRALGKRNKRNRRTGMQEGKVGLNVGKRGPKQFQQGHLLTLGTEDRWTGSKKRNSRRGIVQVLKTAATRAFRGRIKPNDWIRQATKRALGTAAQVAASKAWELIREAVKNR